MADKEKYVIAVVAGEKMGKTCVVNNVWDMLPCFGPDQKYRLDSDRPHEVYGYVDPTAGLRYIGNSKRVGVASRGDLPDEIRDWVEPLMTKYDCNIIVCTCHVRGRGRDETFNTVKNLCDKHGYTLITFSHFCLYQDKKYRMSLTAKFTKGGSARVKAKDADLSRISAKAIVELIEQLT